MTTIEHRPAVTNGAFRTPAPGHELQYRAVDGTQKTLHVLAEPSQTNRRLAITLHTLEPGEKSVAYLRSLEDEGFFILAGHMTFHMPHDDCVIEADAGEFVWHPVGRAMSFEAGDEPVTYLHYLLPGTEFVPGFYLDSGRFDGDTARDGEAILEIARSAYGVTTFPDGDIPPSQRTAESRGPVTPDARLLLPHESDRMVNSPFVSDADARFTMNIDRNMMTDVELKFHAWGHQTGDVFELLEVAWSHPDIVYPHVHTLEEEGFYVLEGEFTLYVWEPDGVTKQVGHAGDFIWGPRDYPHYYHITGAQGARVLTCLVPGGSGFAQYFYGIAVEGRGADLSTEEKFLEFKEWGAKTSGKIFLAPGEWPEPLPGR